ncbi:MAG: hypothetical protein ACYTAF_03245 [Planctomycetota bacterium]
MTCLLHAEKTSPAMLPRKKTANAAGRKPPLPPRALSTPMANVTPSTLTHASPKK